MIENDVSDEGEPNVPMARLGSLKDFLGRHQPDLRKPTSLPESFAREGSGGGGLGSVAERIYKSRRRFEDDLEIAAAGPDMDILLDLFIAQERGCKVAVSTLCLAAQVPPSQALRHIYKLMEDGAIVQAADPGNRARNYVTLSPDMRGKIAVLMKWMGRRLSP